MKEESKQNRRSQAEDCHTVPLLIIVLLQLMKTYRKTGVLEHLRDLK